MKIAITICNFGDAVHVGGNPVYTTEIMDVPDECVPPDAKRHLSSKEQRRWETLSLSIMANEYKEEP